jgi:hypothetical protein
MIQQNATDWNSFSFFWTAFGGNERVEKTVRE